VTTEERFWSTITLRDGRVVPAMTMAEIAAEYAAIRAECPCLIRQDRLAVEMIERRRESRV
jgi:hypothetical protein